MDSAFRSFGVAGMFQETEDEDTETGDDLSDSTETDGSPEKTGNRGAAAKWTKKKGKKIKTSGRDLTADNCAGHPWPWPHFYVWKGFRMRGVEYDALTLGEWVFGFFKQINDPNFKEDHPYMIRYGTSFMQDAIDRPHEWVTLRNMHGVFMTLMERGLITWKKRRQIKALRTRIIYNVSMSVPQGEPGSCNRDMNYIPCQPYQKGNCDKMGSHSGLTHMCAACWRRKGVVSRHTEKECWYKNKDREGQF